MMIVTVNQLTMASHVDCMIKTFLKVLIMQSETIWRPGFTHNNDYFQIQLWQLKSITHHPLKTALVSYFENWKPAIKSVET